MVRVEKTPQKLRVYRTRATSKLENVQKYVLQFSSVGSLKLAVLTAPQSKKVYLSFLGTVEPIHCCSSRFIICILRNHFHICASLHDGA